MESLYRKFKDKGLRILAFPANNFNGQEPGTNKQIKTFCRKNFDVSFDLFAKVSVKGKDKCALYKYLTGESAEHEFKGEVRWNFQKYLIGKDGRIVARFDPPVSPEDAQVIKAIEEALNAG